MLQDVFENTGSARDLGSGFTQKVFDHVVLVPDLFAEQVSTYLDDVVKAPTDRTVDMLGVSPDQSIDRTANVNASPRKDDTTPPLRDQECTQIDHVRQEATAAATDLRSHHPPHTYASLMPGQPPHDQAHCERILAARLRLDDIVNGKDPCWNLPGVRDVLDKCGLESLAAVSAESICPVPTRRDRQRINGRRICAAISNPCLILA